MGFKLKPQKYDLRHLLGMPLACEPLCTVGVVAQKVLTGVVNVLWVLVEAEFIDRAIRLVTGGETLTGMLPLLAAMVLIVAWKRMGYSFGRILTRRIKVSAVYQMSVEAVKKRAQLKFKLIENEGNPDRPWLEVLVEGEEDALEIICRNSIYKSLRFDRNRRLLTIKDSGGHGYGSRIIRQTAEKYEGEATYHAGERELEVAVRLKRPRSKNKFDQGGSR